MTRLLFIQASPRGSASKSIAIAERYLEALRAKHPGLEVDTIELWEENLPAFDGNRANAKLNVITGSAQSDSQRTQWDEITSIAQRFIAADHYLFAVPMWNGGIPYRLKQYIDIIHQPGLLFGLDPATGYFGLLKGKRATLAYTSGAFSQAAPQPAFGTDHHATYLRDWLAQAGVTEVEEIRFQPTLLTADPGGDFERALADAASRAR
jgi:FMN-dependent NADH-azoreductase